ncbi:MAG: hypothetical protein WBL44_12000 [Nitrososphaeraceae archaeon]|jgi:hypothetical protein
MLPKNEGEKSRSITEGYGPDRSIVKFMIALLQYKEDVKLVNELEEHKRYLDKGKVDLQHKEKIKLEEHKRYLDKEKVGLLNNCIFPSMANIVFFFKYISRYPELKEVFDNDIKDLLGVRRENPNKDNYGYIFSDLLRSIIMPELGYYNEEKLHDKDFRLRLTQILQETVIAKTGIYLIDMFTNESIHVVQNDFNRAKAWVEAVANSAGQNAVDSKPPNRPIRFGITQIKEDDELI